MTASVLKAYADSRLAKVLLIGIISGLPWVLHGAMITLWLKDAGFTRSAIGLFGYIATVYALNFLWAPLVDALRIPWLGDALGRRRSWILMLQAVILLSAVGLYFYSLPVNPWVIATFGLIIAAASATQDVAIDAMRIELMQKNESAMIAAGAAIATAGWYTGYNAGGAIALYAADWLKQAGVENPWGMTYLLMAVVIVATNIALLFAKEPASERAAVLTGIKAGNASGPVLGHAPGHVLGNALGNVLSNAGAWIRASFWLPLSEFFRRNGMQTALLLLGFIVLFKVGEAFLGRMSLLFYREVGFSEADIATYSKLLGWGTIVVFSILGSLFSIRYGLLKGLIICGIAMAATNLMFAWLARVGPDISLFAAAVVSDQFTSAISTVAFVAFISQLCDRAYTATQYALLASIGNLSRTTLSAHSGQVVDALGGAWDIFFVLTAVMAVPGLLLLWASRKRLSPYLTIAS